jgi:hypothetical protein
MRVQYRQIPDDAVRAITSRKALCRYYQRDSAPIVFQREDAADDAMPVVAVSVATNYPHVSAELNVGTATHVVMTWSDEDHLQAMSYTISNVNLLLDDMLKIEEEKRQAAKFDELAADWKRDTRRRLSSSAWDMAMNPKYVAIIGMGLSAVPLILKQLRSELEAGQPDHWFVALWAITQENPVPESSRGKIKEMAKAWLAWGEREGFLSGGLGVFLP